MTPNVLIQSGTIEPTEKTDVPICHYNVGRGRLTYLLVLGCINNLPHHRKFSLPESLKFLHAESEGISYKLISLENSAMSMIGSFMDFSPKRASTTSCGALR